MKRIDLRLYFVVVAGLIILSLYANADVKTEWRAQMAKLLSAITEITPELTSDTPESNERFKVKAKNLIETASKLDASKTHGSVVVPDADPALKYLSRLFSEDMKRMDEVIKEGHVSYAKSIARSSVTYCIACHTRTSAGAEFPLIKAFESSLKGASQIQRLSLFTATRQYEQAFSEAMSYFRDDNPRSGDQSRIAQIGLMVAVRAKNSPERALIFVDQIQRSKVTNDYLKSEAAQWASDLKRWQKEFSTKSKNDDELIASARKLMAAESDMSGVKNQGSEVRHLRASAMMHDLLREYPDSKHTAEALFLIGNSYDVMGDLGYWNLGEAYFEACIDKAPHSAQAERCFDRYKESILFGYTGSSGLHLPGAVQRHMDTLNKKAKREAKNSSKEGK